MKRKTKHRLMGLLILVVAGLAALNVLAYNHARAMMRFSTGGTRTSKPEDLSFPDKCRTLIMGVNVPRPVSELSPSALDPECRDISIRCPGGVVLGAWYCDRGRDTPLVILFHGYSAEKTAMLCEGRAFLDLGSSVLLVDFRGSGASSESYTTIGLREAEDVAAAVRYARESLPHSSLVLFGQSMGAAAILRAVKDDGVVADAVILEAVFDTMLNTVRNRFHAMGVPSFPCAELLVFWGGKQWGFNGFAHNPVVYAEFLTCPALFLHGAEDPRATADEGRRVFAAVPGAKEFKEFSGAGHEAYVSLYPDEWRATVAKFMEVLKGRKGPEGRK